MKFKIVHDTPGRIRLRCGGYYFDKNQEKSLEKTILSEQYVESVKAKSVNGGILITYQSDYRQELLNYIKGIKRNQLAAVEDESEDIQADFKNEIIKMLIKRFVLRRILPYPVRVAMAYFKAFPYVKKAVGSVLNLRADVALLDGVALGTALSRGMYFVASLMRALITSLSSSSGRFVVMRPNTTFLLGDTSRNGSKPPERSSSNSKTTFFYVCE